MTQEVTIAEPSISTNGVGSGYGYSPEYPDIPFTAFDTITPDMCLEELNLNWREKDLPERVRTKHVHRLHPYLGKFIPQLVEIFLRKFEPTTVSDPFCGSGTTLVEAASLGINAVGCDISEFNTLMTKVKTAEYDLEVLENEVNEAMNRGLARQPMTLRERRRAPYLPSEYLKSWFAPTSLETLLAYQKTIDQYRYSDVLRVILSRTARSARLTTHFDLDFPKQPQTEPYFCYKHGRTCKPTEDAAQFLKRYSTDTLRRIREFASLRKKVALSVITDDSRTVELPKCDLVITSPPYVGLIDYHEQHKYAYELLGLEWKADDEIGPASRGSSQRAQSEYVDNMVASFSNAKSGLAKDGKMVVIVNDKLGLYDEIRERSGLRLESRLERHVNRRTGRRSGDFFESILVWARAD